MDGLKWVSLNLSVTEMYRIRTCMCLRGCVGGGVTRRLLLTFVAVG